MKIDCFPEATKQWPRRVFADVAAVNPRYPIRKDADYPFVEMASVAENFGGIVRFGLRRLDGSSLSRFKVGDTLFGKITPCPENGKVAMVKELPGDVGLGSTEFIVLSPRDGHDPRFVYALACSNDVRGRAVALMEGSTGRLRVRDDTFTKWLWVPVPPQSDQSAIADVLDACDSAFATAEAKLTAARRLKTALMQQLFTRGMPARHSHFKQTKVGEIPGIWECLKLKKCGKWGTGGTPDRDNKAFWVGTIPWVKSGEVDYRAIIDTEEKITEAGAASINGELLPTGTLLVAMYGAGITRGKAALLAVPAYINQAIAYFIGDDKTNNEWLMYWFERNYERVRALAGGANQDNLSLYLLKNLEIARPLPDEQADIVEILKQSTTAIVAIENEIDALDRLKRSLLQNLLTGRIRLRN